MIRVSFEVMEWDEYFFGESVEEDEKVATHYFAGSDQFIELDKVTGVWSSHGTEPYEGKYKDEVMSGFMTITCVGRLAAGVFLILEDQTLVHRFCTGPRI